VTTIERVADELRSLHRLVHDRAAAPFDVEGEPARRSRQVLARYDGLLAEAARMLEAPCRRGGLPTPTAIGWSRPWPNARSTSGDEGDT